MHDQSLPHYVGLDIGTSTVRCVIGMPDQNEPSRPSIIGFGSAPNVGMRKGVVVYVDDVAESIIQAITEAERIAGVRVHRATVNINGSHVSSQNSKGVVAISAANQIISEDDRMRVEEAATIVQLPPNREIVQVFAKNYRLDGQDNIKDPIGMSGIRLEVDTQIVTAATPNLRNLDASLDRAQVIANRHTVASLASAEAVLNRQQKESGTVLLDIGAGTTNMVVIEDGEVQHIAVIPIGGMHITNDLAIGLKTDLDVAEQVKITHADLKGDSKKDHINVEVNGQTHTFKSLDISMITEARVEELLEYIEKELRKIQRSRKLPGGVVLTGGTANVPGIAEFTREKLQLAARVGQLQPIGGLLDAVNNTASFTAVGLMILDMLLMPMTHSKGVNNRSNTKILNSLSGFLRTFKR